MKEYLDKEVVQEMLENAQIISNGEYYGYCTEDVRLNSIPAANVAEVRHGRWILEREPDGTPYCFHCSVCDNDFHHIGIMTATDYCPNCGALMMEDEHEAG